MVKGKTPRLDGVVVILFLHHWHVIGNDGFEMINEPIGEGSLPACMTKRLITLLHISKYKCIGLEVGEVRIPSYT